MPEPVKSEPDARIQNFSFDVEVDRKVGQNLANEVLEHAAHLDPMMAEGALRDEEWAKQARIQTERVDPATVDAQTQTPPEPSPPAAAPPDRLAQLEAELASKDAALAKSNQELGRLQNKFGDERRRTAERLARLESAARGEGFEPSTPRPTPQTYGSYDPRILGDVDPNVPLTAGQTAALLQNMAAAFGNRLSATQAEAIEAARHLRDYDLTNDEEADLIERHGWLANLSRAAQIGAMRDLVKPLRAASQPVAAPLKPQGVDMAALARAKHLTATTFIEPSSRGSVQETVAATGVDSNLAKKIAEYRELMAKPYGTSGISEKAEALLKEINAMQRRRT